MSFVTIVGREKSAGRINRGERGQFKEGRGSGICNLFTVKLRETER